MITNILLTIITPVLCQFDSFMGMKPDITFSDYNDRYNVAGIIKDQKEMIDRQAEEVQDMEDYRRRAPMENDGEIYEANIPDNNDFAYHDKMDSNEGGDVADFETNLAKLNVNGRRALNDFVKYLHGSQDPLIDVKARRSSDNGNPEKEILMHYAVPISMKINGYLQTENV